MTLDFLPVARLVLLALTVYRLSTMVAYDFGPFRVFERLRAAAGRRAAGGGELARSAAELLHCPYCLGVWFGFAASVAFFFPSPFTDFFAVAMGLSGFQAVVADLNGGRNE